MHCPTYVEFYTVGQQHGIFLPTWILCIEFIKYLNKRQYVYKHVSLLLILLFLIKKRLTEICIEPW